MVISPKHIAGPIFGELDRPLTPSQVRRMILQKAISMDHQELERIATNISVRWIPEEHGKKIPSMILGIMLASEMPISKVAAFASSGAFLAATTDVIVNFCPDTDTVHA